MDIAERTQALALKIRKQKASIETEEATKNAFVMPFISTVLGYDVFNPAEVIPEFTADVGTKKGEKIDYAVAHDGKIQLLVEVKKINDPLRIEHASQLFRYFAVTNARIATLTNGEVYPTGWTPSPSWCSTSPLWTRRFCPSWPSSPRSRSISTR